MNMIPPTQLTELLVASPSTAVNSEFSFTKKNKQTVDVILELKSPDKALMITRVKTVAREAMDADNGMIVYDLDLNRYYFYQQGAWVVMDVGNGDVVGPASSVADNIATFANTSGKLLKDSGVNIGSLVVGPANSVADNIPIFADASGKVLKDSGVEISVVTDPPSYIAERKARDINYVPLEDVNEIREIGNIAFVDHGIVFIDNTFPTMTFNIASLQQSIVVTDGGSLLPTSFDALFEISSTTQTMLFSTLSNDAFSAIADPKPGMFAFNSDTGQFWGYTSTDAGFGQISPRFIENDPLNNLFIGLSAGNRTATGDSNLGTGTQVFENLTTGSSNTIYGQNAAIFLDVGMQNCYFGAGCAGVAANDIQENSGFGFNALNVVTDSQNSAFGAHCFERLGDGASNCGFGWKAGFNFISGQGNLLMGNFAGGAIPSGDRNVIIGQNAGGGITQSVTDCVLIGEAAGDSLHTEASGAVLLGRRAGGLITSGVANTGVGTFSLGGLTTGSYCSALGFGSLQNSGASNDCTGAGHVALSSSLADNNSAFGSKCFQHVVSGTNNTGAGAFCGQSLTSGDDNLLMGAFAGNILGTGSRNVLLGSGCAQNATNCNDVIALGNMAAAINQANGTIAIGTATLQANISGIGCTGIGFNSLVSSSGSYNSAFGSNTATSLIDGASNSFFGSNCASSLMTGSYNVIGGAATLANCTQIDHSVVLGAGACGTDATLSDVVVIGYLAAHSLLGDAGATLTMGSGSHANLTTGTGNLTIGHGSSPQLIDGNHNTIGGFESFALSNSGNDNTTWGYLTLQGSCLDNNTAVGSKALFAATLDSNSAFGALSGMSYAGHSSCTYLGFGADGSANTLSNSTAVGANATFSKSNNITLGDSTGPTSVSIGLDGAADGEILHILGEMAIQGYSEATTAATQGYTHKGQHFAQTNNSSFSHQFLLDTTTLAGSSQVCRVEIGVTSVTSAGFGNSITAVSWDGVTSGAVGGVFPAIVIVTSGAATFTAAWSILADNLVLSVFSDVPANWILNYEWFAATVQA